MKYPYRCKACGKKFEIDVPIHSEIMEGRHVVSRCPYCLSKMVVKQIVVPNIAFKGKGWGKDKK